VPSRISLPSSPQEHWADWVTTSTSLNLWKIIHAVMYGSTTILGILNINSRSSHVALATLNKVITAPYLQRYPTTHRNKPSSKWQFPGLSLTILHPPFCHTPSQQQLLSSSFLNHSFTIPHLRLHKLPSVPPSNIPTAA
jgi:hypothetical protein